MQPIVDVSTMRASDAATIAGGVTGRELMYRAAKGVYESYPWQGKTAIVCGSGNNAGDGYALALLLQQGGIACTVVRVSESLSTDGALYLEQCKQNEIEICRYTTETDFSEYTEIVDCILGTGFRGEVQGDIKKVIERINQSGKTVISVDINSGLNGDSGIASVCVHSDLTVSIGFLKQGLLLNQAKDVIGRLVNVDIGIGLVGNCRYLIEAKDFAEILKPRLQDSHKGMYGYVSILGGCTEYAGAVKLANLSCAALRAGCGVAQLIVAQSLADAVSPYLLESTLSLLPDQNGHILFDKTQLDRVLAKQAALAVGMGGGSSLENLKILEYILGHYKGRVLIDADGLNTLAQMEHSVLKQKACQVILTPHLKEMERLCGVPIDEIRRDPVGTSEQFAREFGVVVLLKGACTVVTDGYTTCFVNRGCAGMATAGSGDVLSGILVGLLGASPATPLTAACGTFIAGLAGELAEQSINPISMLASDTVAHVAQAISLMLDECFKNNNPS